MVVWKALVMMFGFWVVLATAFFLSDFIMQRLRIRSGKQESIQGILFLAVFFLWWGFFYFWFVY